MENLTDRQVELIKDLLAVYGTFCKYYERKYGKQGEKTIIFNCIVYIVLEVQYDIVCEIIDYIKGVKKEC